MLLGTFLYMAGVCWGWTRSGAAGYVLSGPFTGNCKEARHWTKTIGKPQSLFARTSPSSEGQS